LLVFPVAELLAASKVIDGVGDGVGLPSITVMLARPISVVVFSK
jgi:16S rRNA G527 N7-methylase RsmG